MGLFSYAEFYLIDHLPIPFPHISSHLHISFLTSRFRISLSYIIHIIQHYRAHHGPSGLAQQQRKVHDRVRRGRVVRGVSEAAIKSKMQSEVNSHKSHAHAHARARTHTHTHTCLCVCVCVCV